jgi:ATP-dependent RNA helicase RhlE
LGLEPRLLKALAHEGYTEPTPIQAQAIPHVLEGKDLLGIAQTGTGKTASFALPILQRLEAAKRQAAPKTARTLILSPTRELSAQIADSFRAYGRYMNQTVTTIFGGVGEQPQIQTMKRGIDVLVATPGRLLDLVSQRAVDLSKTEIFVLDEADRMLDMGFIRDIRKLVAHLPRERQNLFFSATMPQEIGALAGDLLKNPVSVSVTPAATTVERIAQRVIHVDNASKRALLIELLRNHKDMDRTLVFTRTKHGADKVVRALSAAGIVSSAIHGNKSQSQRVATLNAFRAGRTRVLIATDIAARGIDVDGITHVINYDLPHVAESYVHRIGRTARAGADGVAIAFCDREERPLLRDIEKVTRQQIPSSEWRSRAPQQQQADAEPPAQAEHKPRPHGDRPRHHAGGKPHGGKPQGAKPPGERHAHGQARDGARPHKGPKKHRKGGHGHNGQSHNGHAHQGKSNGHAPAHIAASGTDGKSLPRFLQRPATRH